MERMLLAFDGTLNDNLPGNSRDSVVGKLDDLWSGPKDYIHGVGSRARTLLVRLWTAGLALGAIDRKASEGLRAWTERGCPEDLAMIGWSRGARSAQLCARLIASKNHRVRMRLILLDCVPTQGLPGVRWLERRLPYTLPHTASGLHLMAGRESRWGYQVQRIPGAWNLWVPTATHRGLVKNERVLALALRELSGDGPMGASLATRQLRFDDLQTMTRDRRRCRLANDRVLVLG
jgi:hypothetical protein